MKKAPHQPDEINTPEAIRVLSEALEKNQGNAIVLNAGGLAALRHLVSAIPSPTQRQPENISEILLKIFSHINKIKVWAALKDTDAIFSVLNSLTEYILSIDVDHVIDPSDSPTAPAGHKVMSCKTALQTVMDQVDYTAGACRVNEMIGAVLPLTIINLAKEAIKNEK